MKSALTTMEESLNHWMCWARTAPRWIVIVVHAVRTFNATVREFESNTFLYAIAFSEYDLYHII